MILLELKVLNLPLILFFKFISLPFIYFATHTLYGQFLFFTLSEMKQ